MADGTPHEPVDPEALAIEQAGPTRVGLRTPWEEFDVAGLTPAEASQVLSDVRQGSIQQAHEMFTQMLQRDPDLEGHFTTLKGEIDAVELRVKPATDETSDLEKAELLRSEIVDTSAFRDARFDLLDGLWHGFAAIELQWDTLSAPWRIDTYEHRPQQWFVPDRARGRTMLLRTLDGTTDDYGNIDMGEPLVPGKWVVYTPRIRPGLPSAGGLAMPCVGMHVFASYVWRFWMGLAEGHGHPVIWGEHPADWKKSQTTKLKAAIKDLGHRARATMPAGGTIKSLGVEIGGLSDFHETLTRTLSGSKAIAIFGSNMMSEEGGSLAKTKSLGERLRQRRNMFVRRLDATCNDQVVKVWADNVFGDGTPGSGGPYPAIAGQVEEPDDGSAVAKAMLDASKAMGHPLPVRLAEVFERLAWDQPEEGDKLVGGLVWKDGVPVPDPDVPKVEPLQGGGDGDGDADGDGDGDADDGGGSGGDGDDDDAFE